MLHERPARSPTETAPFASVGPQGHRNRMRTRLLAGGPDGLADYELLEMLLFLGVPRRDTKPLAKFIINRFGDIRRSLTAKDADLRDAGLNPVTIEVLASVREAARRLAVAEAVSRPRVNDTASLLAYLDLPTRRDRPGHVVALLLNNRNYLLAELPLPDGRPGVESVRMVARRAVEVHATALIVASVRLQEPPDVSLRDEELVRGIGSACAALSVALHDYVVFGLDGQLSLRRLGML